MELLRYLKVHTIVSIGKLDDYKCVIVETIVDNPKELVEYVVKDDCYISEIRWWDRATISEKSKIGYGGTLDPRDSQNYYFAETDICASFEKTTTVLEYTEYLDKINAQYATYDLYPAFDIFRK